LIEIMVRKGCPRASVFTNRQWKIGMLLLLFLVPSCIPPPQKFVDIKKGMREKAVRQTLGEPYKEYEKGTAPDDYYVGGYTHPNRGINHRVLIYISGDWICYIFIDDKGLVEETFVGGS
jgi:hypothetical protein